MNETESTKFKYHRYLGATNSPYTKELLGCLVLLLKQKRFHFYQRSYLFQNEAMTGTHTQNPIYSRITMALMEDTGWYLPNYELADELKWGSQLGNH